jgi:hypothetical protein
VIADGDRMDTVSEVTQWAADIDRFLDRNVSWSVVR